MARSCVIVRLPVAGSIEIVNTIGPPGPAKPLMTVADCESSTICSPVAVSNNPVGVAELMEMLKLTLPGPSAPKLEALTR